uniref:GH16 domain-containing protein n=1 Tax=Lotharella oceanica TaxID=641309 RepID=A0A7S2TPW5_9EUKA|mmetsp:Transcript_21714/g.40676  ORF Transcript_21714/g.40676 Transcript_21714/m.40676 type:complete len:425 (+) Transcript_21714:498-1772(+)
MGGGGNWEFEMYINSRRNSYVRDGVLFLKPTLSIEAFGEDLVLGANEDWTMNRADMWGSTPADMCTGNQFYGCERISTDDNPLNYIQSGRVRTAESFSFKYGRVEVRAALPRGDWLWPAIWMLPQDNVYGPWPASGEIDIMESRGNAPSYISGTGQHMGCDSYGATLHWGPAYNTDGFAHTMGTYTLEKDDFSKGFHIFGLYWTPDELIFYVDDESNVVNHVPFKEKDNFWKMGLKNGVWKSDKNGDIPFKKQFTNPWVGADAPAPFDQEFYLIFNLAVGGTAGVGPQGFFPDGLGNKPWTNTDLTSAKDFIAAKDDWLPTWSKNGSHGQIGESAALRIDSVNVWGFEGISTWTYHNNYTGKAGIVSAMAVEGRSVSGIPWGLWALMIFVVGVMVGLALAPNWKEVKELSRAIQTRTCYGAVPP